MKVVRPQTSYRVVLGTGRLTIARAINECGEIPKIRKAMDREARPTNLEYNWVWLFLDTIMSMNEQMKGLVGGVFQLQSPGKDAGES